MSRPTVIDGATGEVMADDNGHVSRRVHTSFALDDLGNVLRPRPIAALTKDDTRKRLSKWPMRVYRDAAF